MGLGASKLEAKSSRLPCSVFCICQLTEQEVVTPYTRRNFVNGTSTARKGLFDWFFLQKRHSIYISPAQKQLTGRKMDKNPPKKGVFLAPLASWLSLSVSVAQQIRTKWVCPYLLRRRKALTCKQCEFSCKRASYLKTHTKIHFGEKPFSCTQCNYSFTLAGTLKSHMLTHTGEKAFSCEQCNYSCTRSQSLKRHMLRHSEE